MSRRSRLVWLGLLFAGACSSQRGGAPQGEKRGEHPRSIDVVRREVADENRALKPEERSGTSIHRPPVETSNETDTPSAERVEEQEGRLEAEAKFTPLPGSTLSGEAELKEVAGGVQLEMELDHAPPGRKGIHVYEKGDCSNLSRRSMGKHFAPMHAPHGLPTSPRHHLGDLGNIDITKEGEGNMEITIPAANLHQGDERSFLGKVIVVQDAPDVGSGSSGEAGKPIGCAVIRED